MSCAKPEASPPTVTTPGPSLNVSGDPLIVLLGFGQPPMNKMNGDRSFSDSGRDALDIAGPHVAHGEHSGQTRLQHLWRPHQGPHDLSGYLIQIAPGKNKTFIIESDASL